MSGVPRGGWAEDQKRKWCRRELGNDITLITCESRDKHAYCRNIGDILIDDRRAAGALWEKAGGIFIHHQSAIRTLRLLEAALGRHSPIQNPVKSSSNINTAHLTVADSTVVDNAAVAAENRQLMNPRQIIDNLSNTLDAPVGDIQFQKRGLRTFDSQSSTYSMKAKSNFNYETNLKKAESTHDDKENKFESNHSSGSWHSDNFSLKTLLSNNQKYRCFKPRNKVEIDSQRDSKSYQNNDDSDDIDESNLVVYNNITESTIMCSNSNISQKEPKPKFFESRLPVVFPNEIREKIDRGTQGMKGKETEILDSYQETINSLVTLIVFYSIWDHNKNVFNKNKEFQLLFCSDIHTKTITSIYFTLFSLGWGKYLYENCSESIFNQRYGAFRDFFLLGDFGTGDWDRDRDGNRNRDGERDSFRSNSDLHKRALYWIELIYVKYKASNIGKCLSKHDVENFISDCICSEDIEIDHDHDMDIDPNSPNIEGES